jgi:hypothetical protein
MSWARKPQERWGARQVTLPLPKSEDGRLSVAGAALLAFLGTRIGDEAEVRERRQQRLKRRVPAARAGDRRLGDRRGAEEAELIGRATEAGLFRHLCRPSC